MKRSFFITLFLIFVSFCSFSNRLKHLSTHNGLSSKRTFSIEKDTKGFFWISTRLGIDRYDGSSVKQYSLTDKSGTHDLTGRINVLTKDNSQCIWTYTNFGQVFQYDEYSDQFSLKLDLIDKFPDTFPLLNGILFVNDEKVIVYGSFGVWIYNLIDDTLQPIKEFKDMYIFTMIHSGDRKLTTSTDKGSYIVSFIHEKNNILIQDRISIDIHERVQCIHYENFDSCLLLGTFSGKLFTYDIKDNSLKRLDFDFKTSIRDIKCYNNTIYIGTNGAGLITLNRSNKKKQEHGPSTFLNDLNLASYSFYEILLDDNRLWIATNSDGVYLLDENLPKFQNITYQPQKNKDRTNSLNTFLEDSDGNQWFGTNDGVFLYKAKERKWIHLLKNDIYNNITRYNALALCEDNDGNIWVGGDTFGRANCINKKTLAITENFYFNVDTDTKGDPVNGRIYTIFKDSKGNIWLGGLHGWLTKFDPKSKKAIRYNIKSVNVITEYDNCILAGTVRGLYIQDESRDTFTHVLTQKNLQSEMLSYINVIYKDSEGFLWLGSEGGLLKFDRVTHELKVFSKANGLLTNTILGILPDKRNRIWMSTEKGLVCFNPQENNFIYFGVEEGLSDERFAPRSQFQRKNGDLLFGNNNGLVLFTPETIDHLVVNSHLVLTDFSINYQTINPATHKDILARTIDKTSNLKLNYSQNTFSFGFTSINFTNSHRTRFEWILEGYDKNWIKGSYIKNIYYTNVPPGTYTFHLRSINSNNNVEIDRKSIIIHITPPFWASTTAKICYVFILFALIWIIIQFIKERLEKKDASEKIRFFTHTAHELKTPVTLIKGPLNKLLEKEHLSKEETVLLSLVVKNTNRLNNLVSQLLDFQKTEMSDIKLYVSEHELTEYIQEKLESFKGVVDEKNIQLSLISNTDAIHVWFDEDQMDKILNNLLSNAFKYTPCNGEIKVTISLEKNYWQLKIRDNGIGIPKQFQKNIYKPFYRADNAVNSTETGNGIGLLLTKNLVYLHYGKISYESVEGVGSVFSVKFPMGKKHFNRKKTVFIEQEVAEAKETKRIEPDTERKLSILIIEDNDELRYFLRQCLTHKYLVHEAINGNEGMKLSRVVLPELIISDVIMPEMDGFEFCKKIKENKETSHIPIILLTALDDKEKILKGYKLRADNYVTKPFDTDILLLTIENTISTRQALRRNLMIPLEKEISSETALATNELDKAFLDEVMEIIDENISNSEYTINDLCKEIAMSRTSFYNKIKVLTDQSPNSFIRIVRLNRAAQLLKKGHQSITHVAALTGFGDVKYFSTAFKKHFGMSPKRYILDTFGKN